MSHDQKRVVLVDTNAFIHAAWHAYPSALGPDGLCYRVIHGMISKLHRLERFCAWDLMIAVLDPNEGSLYRKTLFPAYKANRPALDPDFTRQKDHVEKALRAFGVNVWREPGVESDDLLGSMAKREAAKGSFVMIVTPDKDLSQMVAENISILRPIKGEESIKVPFDYMDKDGVKNKYGVWPHQIADWLALQGDASDNIPGVDKVGAKTAAKWLEQYGDLETLMAYAHEIKGVAAKNLHDMRDMMPVVKLLTTIQVDLEIDDSHFLNGVTIEENILEAQKLYGMPDWMGRFGLLDDPFLQQRSNQSPAAPRVTEELSPFDQDDDLHF